MKRRPPRKNRDGVVSVEFAFVAPIFVLMLIGLSQASYLFNVQNQFLIAAREGARISIHERAGAFNEGQTTNEKIETDVRNFLNANGLPGNDVDVYVAAPDDKTVPFDLDDPANELKYFQVVIEHSVNDLLSVPPPASESLTISASMVFRNGRFVSSR